MLAARADLFAWRAGIDPERLIFLDEFGTNLGQTRTYARAPIGIRAPGPVPFHTNPGVTLTFALRVHGIVAPWAFEGATNGEAYATYVRTQLAPHLHPGDVVLADRLAAHRNPAARAAIEATGASYRLLPPYSPDLNPIENAGSQVKRAVRADGPRTVRRLYSSLGRALQRVHSTDAQGYFAHGGYAARIAPGKESDNARGPPV